MAIFARPGDVGLSGQSYVGCRGFQHDGSLAGNSPVFLVSDGGESSGPFQCRHTWDFRSTTGWSIPNRPAERAKAPARDPDADRGRGSPATTDRLHHSPKKRSTKASGESTAPSNAAPLLRAKNRLFAAKLQQIAMQIVDLAMSLRSEWSSLQRSKVAGSPGSAKRAAFRGSQGSEIARETPRGPGGFAWSSSGP